MYLVSEEDETVPVHVVVSTNGEHLTPVEFQLVFTSTSAVGTYVCKTLLCSDSTGLYYHTSFVCMNVLGNIVCSLPCTYDAFN